MSSAKKIAVALAALGLAAGAAGTAVAGGSDAHGKAVGSPGVVSGNVIQVPLDIPLQVCGNSVNVIGLLNPAMGNRCLER
ncbi:chaplin [Streptomyces sp. M19]